MGPGKSIGAVTQRRYAALPFIRVDSINSFRVGLCSLLFFLITCDVASFGALDMIAMLEMLGSKARKALQIFVQNNDCSGRC